VILARLAILRLSSGQRQSDQPGSQCPWQRTEDRNARCAVL